MVAAAAATLLLRGSGSGLGRGRHLTMITLACAAALLLPGAASVSSVIRGLGPFDVPFEPSRIARANQILAADAPTISTELQRVGLQRPPGDALLATDTSGLASVDILYTGREVLPIGGYLGNAPAPTLATLQADINSGYVHLFVLPVSPAGTDPRVLWIESHCYREPPRAGARPLPYASFLCAGGAVSTPSGPTASPAPVGSPTPVPSSAPAGSLAPVPVASSAVVPSPSATPSPAG
jgi:hypothetical protein